jgi:hypothetical protein
MQALNSSMKTVAAPACAFASGQRKKRENEMGSAMYSLRAQRAGLVKIVGFALSHDSPSFGAIAATDELVYPAPLTKMLFVLFRDAVLWSDLWNEITVSHHSQRKQRPSQEVLESFLTPDLFG